MRFESNEQLGPFWPLSTFSSLHTFLLPGVRSLAFSRSLLSIGGGKGKINFYDLRAGRFFDPAAALEPDWRSGREMHRLQTGSGYLARNQVYM